MERSGVHASQDSAVAADCDDEVGVTKSVVGFFVSQSHLVGGPPSATVLVSRDDAFGQLGSLRQQAVMGYADCFEACSRYAVRLARVGRGCFRRRITDAPIKRL